ncbi:hypothetical protein FZC76_18965 [Sutcliffiella horikoshii]|uniref:Uncharacterized protein n=1 Tax=Sutcliffiella horikoshii TaxID=79883 RepID=A0A5D4SK19_9BACI|nr:hypothetical protein [Sutcliffiella horikoshii]TYS63573.1 hypothetical protein FZC76_18965 [Sutcliffiella horikoshii]
MKAWLLIKKCLLLMVIGLFIYPSFSNAETNLEVKVEFGVDNKVQMGKGHQIRIDLVNKGDAIKGDVVVFTSPTYNMAGSYVIPVEIEAGGSKTLELAVKGTSDHMSYNYSGTRNDFVSFYEGGVEKGKEVKLKGNANAQPRYIGDNRVVLGVLSNNHDAVNFLKLVKYQNESMELLNIKSENIPNESYGLELFDVLLVHDFPLATLTAPQQQAIKDWVNNGGSLMFDTKVGLSQDLGDLQEFQLLDPTNETSLLKLNEKSSFPDLPIFTGNIIKENATVLTKDGETPITLMMNTGTGTVTQITSNLASPLLGEWSEINTWWSSVLQKVTTKSPNHYKMPVMEELSHQLSPIGEAFPGSIVSVPLLIGAFAIYLILVIPVLYIILKRTDKREQAWWIIPTIAILTSIAVFGIGAKDRISGTQVNEASILLLDNETETASGYGVASILTNSGGDYRMETGENTTLFPMTYGYNENFELMKNYAYVSSLSKGTDIRFNNVEYWSTRTSIGNVNALPLGKIEHAISMKDGNVQGTISNQMQYELKDAFILSGRNSEPLGDIKAGETVDLEYEVSGGNVANALTAPSSTSATKAFPNFQSYYNQGPGANQIEKDELEDYKKFQMLDLLVNRKDIFSIASQPILVGYVTEGVMNTKVDGKSGKSNASHLVVLPITITNSGGGSFSFAEEHLSPSIQVTEGETGMVHHNGLQFGENYLYLGGGTYDFNYSLPDMVDITKDEMTEVKVKLRTRDGSVEYSIYNHKTGEAELLENKSSITLEGNLSDYFDEQGSMTVRLRVPNNFDMDIQLPGVQVEGALNE